tara:strand:- start:817 stop:936 length:120 start_codon:yes stop_codon:yes gene_type:complete
MFVAIFQIAGLLLIIKLQHFEALTRTERGQQRRQPLELY